MIRYVVEHSGYTYFAEAGLVLFAAVFVVVLINAFCRSKSEMSELSRMAIEPEEIEKH